MIAKRFSTLAGVEELKPLQSDWLGVRDDLRNWLSTAL
jgi:hypothetical protein